MRTFMGWRLCFTLLAMTLANHHAFAAGVVTAATESNLRAALAGGGNVTFAVSGTITLTGTLVITNNTVLDASGNSIVLSGAGSVRVLSVWPNVNCTLKHLTVADGYRVNDHGAGLFNEGLTKVIDCTFSNNATVQISGPAGFGGAIGHGRGSLSISGSTFVHNRSDSTAAAISVNYTGSGSQPQLAVTNSTFFGNWCSNPSGGALQFFPPFLASWIVNCTFAWNTNGGIRASAFAVAPQVTLINTIVANSSGGADCGSSISGSGTPDPIRDGGYNLVSDSSVMMTNVTTLRNTNPLLGLLTNNGGPTPTLGLLAGSPAIDSGNVVYMPATDQRGVSRPVGFSGDRGAFEGTVHPPYASTVRFITTNYFTSELASSTAIQIERTGNSDGSVSVALTAAPGSAVAGADFVPTNITVTFASGEFQRTAFVTILNDAIPETNKTVLLSLHDPSGTVLDTPDTAILNLVDDDAVLTITNCTDEALRTAMSTGGWVQFDCDGTIYLTNSIIISNSLTLDASGHAITISGSNNVQLFEIQSGVALSLKNLNLVDGLALGTNGSLGVAGGPGRGGAILNLGGILEATGCTFQNNMAKGGTGGSGAEFFPPPLKGTGGVGYGGVIYNSGGQVYLTNCVLSSNQALGGAAGSGAGTVQGADSAGGAIYNANGQVQLVLCTLSNNLSMSGRGTGSGSATREYGFAFGGAIQNEGGSLKLIGTVAIANVSRVELGTSVARGGAICLQGGQATFTDSLFRSNVVLGGDGLGYGSPFGQPGGAASGGAICVLSGTVAATNTTFDFNSTLGGQQASGMNPGAGSGGGVYNLGGLTMVNCTFYHNVAQAGNNGTTPFQGGAYGGSIYNQGGTVALENLTIASGAAIASPTGTAVASGGGIHNASGSVALRNTLIAYSSAGSNCFGMITDLGHNLSSDASAGFSAGGSLNNTDPKLGPLDFYVGATPTMPLLTGSPAIDGGDNVNFPPTDQRGHARPYGAAADIGAFESSPPYVIRGAVSGATLNEEVGVVTSTTNVLTVNHGRYSLEQLAAGTYSVVPTSANFLFQPTNRVITVGPDQLNVDFKAYRWNALSLESATNGVLHLAFAGTNGASYRMLASSNLVNWFPVSTNSTGTSNLFEFFDAAIQSNPTRFYKTVSP